MHTINAKGRLIPLDKPIVMGILNITPDSFFEGSRFTDESSILKQAEKMILEGATILDIGGMSSRPGAPDVDHAEELKRVLPAILSIQAHFPEVLLSVDTFRASIAREAVAAGASMINDISGGEADPEMINTAADLKVPYCCMHMKGNAQTMNAMATYKNLTDELLDYFIKKKESCLKAGIKDVIIDPGFGFAKTIDHNFELLRKLSLFKMIELPILVGLSRKSTIYKTLGVTAAEALNGTTVLNTLALSNGASILRVHDVKEAVEAIRLWISYEGHRRSKPEGLFM